MEISTPFPENSRVGLDPQRRAWGILLMAFAVFCLICVVTGVGVSYFLFQSTIPLETSLQIARGTGGVSGQVVRIDREISIGDVLSTDRVSQATVFLRDAQADGRLLTMLTLRGETSVLLFRSFRPRFEWGSSFYGAELRDFSGELDVFVANDLGRDFRLVIDTRSGAQIDLSSSGQYTLIASETQVRVINRDGHALLIPARQNEGRDIPVNSQGMIFSTDPASIVLTPAYVNLLDNSTFQETFALPAGDETTQSQVFTQGWACSNTQNSPPRGSFQPETQDGRTVLRLLRAEGATSHGVTLCGRWFGRDGYDLSGLNYLSLRATMKINYQSLAVCGFDGSECPLMLRMDYVDEQNAAHQWYHGFYYNPNPEYPLRCSSCSLEHEIINEKAWYNYESGNLFALFPVDQRPKSIINVQFYASGHQYDVFVGEIALLAGQTETTLAG